MTHPWDEFSKSLAESVPRRESLRRLGLVFAGAALSPFAAPLAWARGQDPCKTFCNQCPKSQRSQCLAACQACNSNASRLCGSCGNYTCCASGLACCSGACVDLFEDYSNCGGCGHACEQLGPYEDGACVDGTCQYQCVDGALFCNGACTPVLWDPQNCGACGNVCSGSTPYCNQGTCRACAAGQVLCGGLCVDLANDPNNCGACGNVCGGPNPSCYQGACSTCTGYCPEGWCGGDGCGGACACPAGWACDGNWCYYDPPSDCTPDHPYYPNCCPGGSMICGGVCIDVLSDPYNCGACGNVCEPGFVCSSGACWDPACQFNDC